jgi:nitroreductase
MNIKIPNTQGPVMDAIKNRWSPRSFAERTISAADMETIIEAGCWAFSASNEQPWRFVVAHRGTPLFSLMWGLLAPGNQVWCKDAAVLMLTMVQTKMGNGNLNPWAQHDLGAANFAMTLQANSMDIYNHVMAGFDKARSIPELELPADIEPIAMLAFGYVDAPDKLPEPFLARELAPRSRKSVAEVVLRHD